MARVLFLTLLCCLTSACNMLGGSRPVTIVREQGTTPAGVRWRELLVGRGEPTRAGDLLTIDYVASLSDGTRVDATTDRGLPVEFRLGAAPIKGWNEGLVGMRVGGKRRLDVPANLAYGRNGVPGLVPPNADLVFDVELLSIDP